MISPGATKVYLTLYQLWLESGPTPLNPIVQTSWVTRSTTLFHLESLEDRGLVSVQDKLYSPTHGIKEFA